MADSREDAGLRLPDGRRLGYAEYGDEQGRPVIYHHGLMASRFEAAFADADARRLGLRLIAVDRPGYGGSAPKPARTLAEWAEDVAALTQALGLTRFHLLGISGGGPYALACAKAMPERVTGLTLICSLGPPESLRELEAGPATRLFKFAGRYPYAARIALAPLGTWLRRSPIGFVERMMVAASPPDRTVLSEGGVRDGFAKALREGARQGLGGALTDIALYGRDWGFRLEEVGVPVELWQGGADHLVAPAVAHYLAACLPTVKTHFFPEEGHFSLPIRYAPQILASLAATPVD